MVAPGSAISTQADGSGAAPDDEDRRTSDELAEDELFAKLKRWTKDDDKTAGKWRKQAEDDYGFVDGHQYDKDDESYLLEQGRHPTVFNRLGPIIDTICGLEVNNREEISIKPRSRGDEPAAACATDLVEWIRDEADVEDEESEAFRDSVVSGMGWVEHFIEEIDEAQIKLQRVDPWEMSWDASSKRRNLGDAKRITRKRDAALDEARAMFPGFSDSDLDAGWARGDNRGDDPVDRDLARDYASGNEISEEEIGKRGRVTIVEVQWRELLTEATLTDGETGEKLTLPAKKAATVHARYLEMGIPVEMGPAQTRTEIRRAFLGRKLLESAPLPVQGEGFTYKPITGKYDRKEGLFYGIVRSAKHPQEWANKWLSQSIHILNTMANNGVDFEEGAFVDQAKAEKDWTQSGSFIAYSMGALKENLVRPRFSNQGMPTGMENILQFALQSIRDATGVSPELIGLADREQAGVLEIQRKQAGVTTLASFFDSLRRFRKASGRMTLKYALELLPTDQLARALGEEHSERPAVAEGEPPKLSPLEQLMAGGALTYDVIVEEAPTSTNGKERAWAAVSPLLPILLQRASPTILAEIVRASPLPPKMAEAMAAEITKPPSPEQQQKTAEQEQLAKAGAETSIRETAASAMQKQTQAELNRAKIAETQANAQEAEMKGVAAVIEAQTPDVHMHAPPRPSAITQRR